MEEIHGHGTVGALQGNPQAPGNRGTGRVFILGVQELQESLTALRVQKEVKKTGVTEFLLGLQQALQATGVIDNSAAPPVQY